MDAHDDELRVALVGTGEAERLEVAAVVVVRGQVGDPHHVAGSEMDIAEEFRRPVRLALGTAVVGVDREGGRERLGQLKLALVVQPVEVVIGDERIVGPVAPLVGRQVPQPHAVGPGGRVSRDADQRAVAGAVVDRAVGAAEPVRRTGHDMACTGVRRRRRLVAAVTCEHRAQHQPCHSPRPCHRTPRTWSGRAETDSSLQRVKNDFASRRHGGRLLRAGTAKKLRGGESVR